MRRRLTDAQAIEYFHLAFLQVLPTRIDRAQYVLKGGANLRYFLRSVRYSEDMDLDAVKTEAWRLEAKVDDALHSPAMRSLLGAADMVLDNPGKSKQTDTTQRWKPRLAIIGRREPVRTRIEFSHRSSDPRRTLEAVPDSVTAPYALRPPTVLHYTADAAIEQKILALAQRSETQARDVFDLELLMREYPSSLATLSLKPRTIQNAVDRAGELTYETFRDQVLPFIDPEVAELYGRAEWEQIRQQVADRLVELI